MRRLEHGLTKGSLDHILQALTAVLLAAGLSIWIVVLLVFGEQPGRFGHLLERRSIIMTASAVGLATLTSWWLQRYVLDHDLMVRLIYAFTMIFVSFIAIGGTLIVLSNVFLVPDDFGERQLLSSLRDLYWDGLDGSYSFLLFAVTALRLQILVVLALGALFISVFRY